MFEALVIVCMMVPPGTCVEVDEPDVQYVNATECTTRTEEMVVAAMKRPELPRHVPLAVLTNCRNTLNQGDPA